VVSSLSFIVYCQKLPFRDAHSSLYIVCVLYCEHEIFYFMAVKIEFVVFWVVAPFSVVVGYQCFRGPCCLHLVLQNVGIQPQCCMAQQLRKPRILYCACWCSHSHGNLPHLLSSTSSESHNLPHIGALNVVHASQPLSLSK
jgi:hypothetical protein